MLHTVDERRFKDLMIEKEFADETRKPMAIEAYSALATEWISTLSAVQFTVLSYIVHRTLSEGRLAARIPMGEFLTINLSKAGLRNNLHDLTDLDFLEVYRTVSGDDSHEKEARMYAINCKKLLKLASDPLQQVDTPLYPVDPPSYINYIDSGNRDNKDKSLYSARPSQSSSAKEPNVFPISKKVRAATVVRSDSIASVISSVTAKAATIQASRVAGANFKSAHQLDKLEMQAIFDKAMKQYAPEATRLIVTGKEFGLLRKRLREQPPADFLAFAEWVVRYWSTLAHQHRVAVKRSETRKERGEQGLPMAINFATLCYRYPYFLAAYANFLAERKSFDKEDSGNAEALKLKRQLQESRDNESALKKQLVRTRAATVTRRTAPAPRVAPTPMNLEVELDSSDLPAWDAQNTQTGGKRYGNR